MLDSVLWFHVECPKASAKFDDPVEFKKKFRDFFAQNKSIAEAAKYKTKNQKMFQENYGFAQGYPEDVKQNKKVLKFAEEFQKYTPDQ